MSKLSTQLKDQEHSRQASLPKNMNLEVGQVFVKGKNSRTVLKLLPVSNTIVYRTSRRIVKETTPEEWDNWARTAFLNETVNPFIKQKAAS